jgi:dipeptidyl aminopeptidase/acylaminoacyl peptidase
MARMRRPIAAVAVVSSTFSFAVACGPDAPEPNTPTSALAQPSTAPSAAAASVSAPTPPPPSSDPTALTDAQKARDAARVPAARAIVDAYGNFGGFFSSLIAEWTPDGKHFIYNSGRDGLPEIYMADPDKPDAEPVAVTRGPERAISGKISPDGKWIYYFRDAKGDEAHHVWKVAVGAAPETAIDLTPESQRRGELTIARKKPDTLFFSAPSKEDGSRFALVVQAPSAAPRVVFVAPRSGGLDDVTADGARALFSDSGSRDDVTVNEIDVASGKARRIFPADGKKASGTWASYSTDGKRIFLATDDGTESSFLLAFDAQSGKEIARYASESPKGAQLSGAVSPKGDLLALGVEAGDHGEVRILDAKTLKLVRNVTVPLGEIHVGSFRPDGKAFSILVSEPSHPSDPYAVDLATGTIKPLRADKRSKLDALGPITMKIEHVKAFDGLDIPINRYLPGSDEAAPSKLPTIVIFHGGPASSYPVRWSPYARFFLSQGYAVMEPNVRGSTGFGRSFEMADNKDKRADWLRDVETVNAWVKAQAWCDPSRVFVWGQSYGGYTTLMALTRQPTLWRAGVDLYGPADMRRFMATTNPRIRKYLSQEFGDPDTEGDLLDRFSPMRDVDKIAVPLFVYTGQNDTRVPRSESDAIVKALRARGVPVEYMVAENEGHSVDRKENQVELLTRTARFFEDAVAAQPAK